MKSSSTVLQLLANCLLIASFHCIPFTRDKARVYISSDVIQWFSFFFVAGFTVSAISTFTLRAVLCVFLADTVSWHPSAHLQGSRGQLTGCCVTFPFTNFMISDFLPPVRQALETPAFTHELAAMQTGKDMVSWLIVKTYACPNDSFSAREHPVMNAETGRTEQLQGTS